MWQCDSVGEQVTAIRLLVKLLQDVLECKVKVIVVTGSALPACHPGTGEQVHARGAPFKIS
jgi:hypothetical protein